jgi:hypothetical protein
MKKILARAMGIIGVVAALQVSAQEPPGPPTLSERHHGGTHASSNMFTVCQASPYYNDAIEWTVYYSLPGPGEPELVDAYLLYDYNSGTQIVEDLFYMIQNPVDEFIWDETFLAPQMEEWNNLFFVFEYADGTYEVDNFSICWPYVW